MLNKADAAWREYRSHVCGLSYDYFRTGNTTTVAPAPDICKLRLDRAYMQQLLLLTTLEQQARWDSRQFASVIISDTR
jgi:hypothetical protein